MRIYSLTCPHCDASYEVAESLSTAGAPGRVDCCVCGAQLAVWQEPRLKAFRLVLPYEHKYPRVLPPASSA